MAEAVDSIIAELVVKGIDEYEARFARMKRAHEGALPSLKALGDQSIAIEQAAQRYKQGAGTIAQAEEQTTQRVTRSRKARTDAAKQADAEEVASAKAAAKAKTDAIRAEAAAARQAAREMAALDKARSTEQQLANQARASAFLTPLGTRGTSGQSARASADVFKENFKAEAQAAREAADVVKAAEKEKRAAITDTRSLQERADARPGNPRRVIYDPAAGNVARTDAEFRAGLVTPSPAPASVSKYSPASAAATEQNVAGATAAKERALLEAEINDRKIAQLGLSAKIYAADKDEAAILKDQLYTLQLFGRYRALGMDEASAQVKVEAELLGIEEMRVAAAAEQAALVEKQMRAQSGAIANKISGAGALTGALVGGLGAAEISHLNDRYIELSNSLKVAGVSASEFDAVQQHLLDTANKNGTNINALADVFRSASLGAHELGATQTDLLKLTDAASNALRIQGVSATQAQGSLLQLGHAFESGRVNAREFNSLALNLYPILQAAAKGSDQFGGSVAKLRAEIIAGNVSSKVFFDAIIAGSGDLEARASKATLTTAQGFTSLTNALVVYFGQADKAQGVSGALGAALKSLGDNLDTLIPAIAAIGTALTVGYIARMAQAAIATESFGASVLGAFGGPVGLAITAITLAIGGTVIAANDAHAAALQAAEGLKALQDQYGEAGKGAAIAASGIRGVASDALGAIPHVNAFAGAVGNAADQLYRQARAARAAQVEGLKGQLAQSQKRESELAAQLPGGVQASLDTTRRGDFSGNLSKFLGAAKNRFTNLLSGGYRDEDNAKAYRDQVGQSTILQQQIKRLTDLNGNPIGAADIPGGGQASSMNPKDAKALANLNEKLAGLQKLVGTATGARLAHINKQIDVTKQKIADIQAGASASAANAAESGGGGRRGPSAETLAKREEVARKRGVNDQAQYDADLRKAQLDYLQQQADLVDDGVKRAELERERVRFAQDQFNKEIAAQGPVTTGPDGKKGGGTGKFTADQVTTLQGLNDKSANLRIQSIDQAENLRKATDARSIDANDANLRRQQLQAQEGLADTLAKRRDIAKQLLDLEYEEKAKALRLTLNPDSKATAAERTIAQSQLDALPGQKALDQKNLDRQNEGVGRSYLRGLGTDPKQMLEGTEVKVLQDFNSGLDQTVSKALHLHGIFGDIVNDLIDMAVKQALIKPLAASLFSSGDGGGGLGGLFSSIKGALGIGGGGGVSASLSGLSVANTGIPGLGALPGASELSAVAGLPGFANGGSATIGGNPGIDKNVLSINGQPALRVGKGETLSVSPNNIAANNARVASPSGGSTVHQTIAVDARGAVMNDQFAQQILSQAAHYSNAVGQASYQSAVKTAGGQVPGIIQKKQTLGS